MNSKVAFVAGAPSASRFVVSAQKEIDNMMDAHISISRRSLQQGRAPRDGAALAVLLVNAEYAPLHGLVNYEIRADLGREPQYSVPVLDKHMGELFADEPVLFELLFGHQPVLAARPTRGRFPSVTQCNTQL